jgi:ribosomal protein L37AE/L43A
MQVVIDAFEEKYLPGIDRNLMSRLCSQHEELGWPGLIGSLDCSHWEWFRCPKSLHGEYRRGDKDHPTVVYEGACDSDLFIWHCYFALPGSCNDLNVLDTSPLLFAIASGSTMFEYSVLGHFYNQPYVHAHLTSHTSRLTPHAFCQVPSCRRYLSRMDLFFRSSIASNDNDGKELHQCPSCEKKRHRARIWRAAIEMEYFEQAQPYSKLECHEQNFTSLRNLTQHGKSSSRNIDFAFVHVLNQFFR